MKGPALKLLQKIIILHFEMPKSVKNWPINNYSIKFGIIKEPKAANFYDGIHFLRRGCSTAVEHMPRNL